MNELYKETQFILNKYKISANKKYAIMKNPPPLFPATYGNFQRLPKPMAEPAAARIKPMDELKLPRFACCFDI